MGGTRTFEKSTLSTMLRRRSRPSLTGSAVGAVAGALILLVGWMVVGSVPRSESELRFSDGAAWLTSTAFGGISLHDGGDGAAMTNLTVADRNASFDVEQSGSDALVVNDSTGEIARIEAATWSIVRRVPLAEPGEGLDVITGRDAAWLVRRGSVAPLDPESLDLRAAIPVGETLSSAVVADDSSLLFSGTLADDPVRRFGAGPEPIVIDGLTGPVSFGVLADGVVGLDRDDGAVWMDGLGVVCDRLEVPAGAALVGAGSGSMFLAVGDTGSVFAWDPAQGCPDSDDFLRIEPSTFGPPVVADGWAVIPDIAAGEVVVVDLGTMSMVRRSGVLQAGVSFDLIGEDDSIWFNDPASATAGLVRPNGDVIDIQKYTDDGDGGFSVAPSADSDSDLEVAGGADGSSESEGTDSASGLDGTLEAEEEVEEPEPLQEDEPAENESAALEESALEEPALDEPDPGSNSVTPPDEDDTNSELPPAGPVVTTPAGGPDETDPERDPDDISVQISQSKVTAEVGDTVDFAGSVLSGDPISFEWSISPDPGSSGPSDGLLFSRSFETEGLFTVQFTACAERGGPCGSATRQVQVVDSTSSIPLQVSIAGSSTATVGAEATFTALVEGEPDTITWTFQDGTPATASDETATTTFDSVGSKTITVTVARGEERRTDTATIVVASELEPLDFVLRCAPTTLTEGESAQCSIDNYSAAAFGDVVWSQSAPDGSLATFSGDGGRATLRYDGAGSVTIIASATEQATSVPVSDSVTVVFEPLGLEAPLPTISAISTAEIGDTVSFNVTVEGGPAESFSWTAQGTSATSSGESFSASWDAAGDYVVTVTATGPGGTGSDTHTVSVQPPDPIDECNSDQPLEQPTVSATDLGGGTVDVTVTVNKCATADMNWAGGHFGNSPSSLSHSFTITGLTEGERYTFSTTVDDGSTRNFGSTSLTIGGLGGDDGPVDPPTVLVISGMGFRLTGPTSVEIFASTNICAWSDWSGNLVSRNGPRPACFTSHNHMNPEWPNGSLPIVEGGTYTVTLTAHDPDGVLASVSETITVTIPVSTPTTGPTCPDVLDSGVDTDGDGIDDACDPDADGDGDLDAGDSCPSVTNTGVDADGDGIDAACDPDDGDGPATGPTCPGVLDSGVDTDGDGIDDACDPDADGDGDLDAGDSCPGVTNAGVDADGDGIDAACDPDDGATPPSDPPADPPADGDGG